MNEHQIELETKIAFLELNVSELSDVAESQQREITTLQQTLKALNMKVNSLFEGEGISDELQKPPHY